MNYLQKIPLLSAFGSAAYGAFSASSYHLKCRSYSEEEVAFCALYKLNREAPELYETITGKLSEFFVPSDDISREFYDRSQQRGRELCTSFEQCKEMAEEVSTTLISAGLICAVSMLALYIITKIQKKPTAQPDVHHVQKRVKRSRWEPPFQPSSGSSLPAAPPSASSSSSSGSQGYLYEREWSARRNWVGNGADLSGIPGCKR